MAAQAYAEEAACLQKRRSSPYSSSSPSLSSSLSSRSTRSKSTTSLESSSLTNPRWRSARRDAVPSGAAAKRVLGAPSAELVATLLLRRCNNTSSSTSCSAARPCMFGPTPESRESPIQSVRVPLGSSTRAAATSRRSSLVSKGASLPSARASKALSAATSTSPGSRLSSSTKPCSAGTMINRAIMTAPRRVRSSHRLRHACGGAG
mmetsp:Transcript_38951/g.90191  ORF Transcript_38951/g.90191 Transcript_38951/m.90191 type:complete len:206 (-) Transcript_38951:120-737(-)